MGDKVASQPVPFRVFRQTQAPQNVKVRVTPEEPESGWYGEAPVIGFQVPGNDSTYLAPMTVYYRFWNTYDPATHTYPNQDGDDAETIAYQGDNPPVITEDGIYRLSAWVEDAAGNRSAETLEMTFRVDTQNPVITVEYDNNEAINGSYFDQKRTATITIRELNFQEEQTEIFASGSAEMPEVSGFTVSDDGVTYTATAEFRGDGDYALSVSSMDRAGNDSLFPEETFTVDTQSPEQVAVSYEDNWFREILNAVTFHKFFRDTVTVKITAFDETSGVDTIAYWSNGIDGEGNNKNQSGSMKAQEIGEGRYEITFTVEPQFKGSFSAMATDMAGNQSNTVTSEAIYADDEQPNAPNVDTGSYQKGTWTNRQVVFTITGSAAFSGIDRYEYTAVDGELDGSEVWHPLTEGLVIQPDSSQSAASVTRAVLTVDEDVNKTFYFRAVSNSQVAGAAASCKVKIQKTLPAGAAVSASDPNAEGWYRSDPQIVITAPEPTPAPQPESAPVTVYYKLWNTAAGETESSAPVRTFDGRQPEIAEDGEYRLLIWTEDEAGNQCPASQRISAEYRVDYTDPVISLSYDNNNARNQSYYNAGRTATVTVEELNFNPDKIQVEVTAGKEGTPFTAPEISGWSSNGTTHRAYVRFSADGDYSIRISGSDQADNNAVEIPVQSFTVDTEAPALSISGVQDLSANRDPVAPVITYSDINLDIQQVSFSLTGSESGGQSVNGSETTEGTGSVFAMSPITEDDNYRLTAQITDKAGNVTEQSISFSVNQHGSTFQFLQQQVRDHYTNQPFAPSVRVWNIDEVTILSVALNGRNVPYTFENGVIQLSNLVSEDGKYVLTVEVRDAAGNVSSMNPVEFFLDTTSPVIRMEGAAEGEWYFDPVSLTFTLENSQDSFSDIQVNGESVFQKLASSPDGNSASLVLDDYQDYTITAEAVDEAGNRTKMEPIHFTLSNNMFLKLYQNKPLFWGIAAGVCVLLSGGVLLLVRIRKRRNRT